jgi:hypothetical protein
MTTHPVLQETRSSSRRWRIWSIALVAAFLLSYCALSAPPPARAASLETIGLTSSYYIDAAMASMNGGNLDTTFSQLGTAEANRDNSAAAARGACTNGQYTIYAIIDMGQPFSDHVYTWAGSNPSWGSVELIALSYAKSWYNTSYNCFRMHLTIGVNNQVCYNWSSTNNTDPCVTGAGNALAQYVEAANSNLASSGDSWQIDVSGGVDAETDAGWGSYSTTLGFINAYTAKINTYAAKYQLYDFGDATHSCSLDWSCDPTGQVYNIAWNIGYDYPFPEAYSTGQNSQWLEVSQYSSSNPIRYRAALMDDSQTWCTTVYACWQDFAVKNGAWIEGGVLAGSGQEPLG